MKTAGLLMLIGYFVMMLVSGDKIANTVKSSANSLVNVQQTTASHTAAANEVINWAAGQ